MIQQATLFDLGDIPTSVRRQPTGGGGNPIVFHDYESYVAKFRSKEKTTDDTYTPRDVYEAVLEYVRSIYPMEGKEVLRPFYPGGDYRHAVYPDDGVVVDNPPFSIFTEICKFYSAAHIPFFLFGPGMTIFSALKYCSVVVIDNTIEFDNGAKVRCNFATNLIGDTFWPPRRLSANSSLSARVRPRRPPCKNTTIRLRCSASPISRASPGSTRCLASREARQWSSVTSTASLGVADCLVTICSCLRPLPRLLPRLPQRQRMSSPSGSAHARGCLWND